VADSGGLVWCTAMPQITRPSFGRRIKFHQLGSHDSSHPFRLPKLVLRRPFDVIDHDEFRWNLRTLQMETKLFLPKPSVSEW
jgi:hypothetical protein